MKKYVKPDISFQKLNLSTDISAGCAQQAQQAEGICAVQIPDNPGLYIFQESSNTCNIYLPNSDDFICYHVPTADTNVFSS